MHSFYISVERINEDKNKKSRNYFDVINFKMVFILCQDKQRRMNPNIFLTHAVVTCTSV